MKGLMQAGFGSLINGGELLTASALALLMVGLAVGCDPGFAVASSVTTGNSRPTPVVAFKTPRTKVSPSLEPIETSESKHSLAPVTSAPVTATATQIPEPTVQALPTPTVERTLAPVVADTPAAVEEPISQDMQVWLVRIFQDLTAGMTAVRPFEYDPGLVVLNESNNLAMIMPEQLLTAAFDARVRSSYFVRALQIVNVVDATQLHRPALMSELVIVHESEDDAAAFTADYRDFAVPLLGSFSDQYVQENYPSAQRSFQEDSGFGLAEEELILVGEYDLGDADAVHVPQIYIMIGRKKNVNVGLMIFYLDLQSRMRPFALFDRLVSKVG